MLSYKIHLTFDVFSDFKWFRDEVGKEEPDECSTLLTLIAPLAQAHGLLVKDLEQRLQSWDGIGGPKASQGHIADVLLAHLPPLLPVRNTCNLITAFMNVLTFQLHL